ncbi:hypothetical protein E3N88_07706 [Mikania micrantha]|uniref:Uncharacterized protein n=1 Tax=Mikania micrantha TaxID=192012 RepID=A0A5N6PG55_9ASTR|nr:hypothetical protein E3N88_07706 [Mikania micrantha]
MEADIPQHEPETVRDDFTQGLTQDEEGVMRAWWAQIFDTPFTSHRLRATTIRDHLIRYIHRCIMTTISGRGQIQEWVTTTDLFYLHSLIAGRPCNLARCFALYYASFYHRQERDTLWGGAFVTHIARTRGMAAQVFIVPEQQQEPQDDGSMQEPEPIREEPVQSPAREESPPQHPLHVYRAVHLTEPLEALLHQIAARCEEMAQADRRRAAWETHVERRLDHYEDLVQWTSRQSMRDGTGHSFHRSRSHAFTQTTDRPLDHPEVRS